jgi:hypothetical protein
MNVKKITSGALAALLLCSAAFAMTPQQKAAANSVAGLNNGIKNLYNQTYAATSACPFPNCNITNVSLQSQLDAAKIRNAQVYEAVLKARAAINSTSTNVLNSGAQTAFEYQSKLEQLWMQTGSVVTSLQAKVDQQNRAAAEAASKVAAVKSAQASAMASLANSYSVGPVSSVVDSVTRPYQAVNLRQYKQGSTLVNETILKRSGDQNSGLTYIQVKNARTGASIGLPTLYRWGACATGPRASSLCAY